MAFGAYPIPGLGHNGGPSMGNPSRLGFRTFDAMSNRDMRMTDTAGAFLQSELERLDPVLHEPLAGYTYLRDVPLREDVTIADESSSFANLGFAAAGGINPTGVSWVGKTSTAITGIQADIGKVVTPLNLWAMELAYSIPELESSIKVNRPIDRIKLDGLNLKANQDADQIAYVGDATVGSYGLLNSPDVSATNASGSFSSMIAANGSGAQTGVLNVFNQGLMAAYTASGYTAVPNKVGLPPIQFGQLQQVVSSAGGVSILEFLKKNTVASSLNGADLEIVPMKWAVGRGVGGTDRMVFYTQDQSRVRLPITPMLNTPIQYRGIHYLSYYYRRIGAVEITNSQLVYYVDGV